MIESQEIENIVIIGSGPAGYTAGIYAGRADLNPVIFSGLEPGGQLMITTDVENYPGFPEGILGPEVMDLFKKQAERFGARVINEVVDKIDLSRRPFKIQSSERTIFAKSVIISTGAAAKWLGLAGEQTWGGYGVSACATCDGFFFRGKEVAVVGGGDTAMEEANYLTRHASKVTLIHRRDQFRASKIMQDRVLANPKINVIWNTAIEEILGEVNPMKKITGLRLRNVLTNTESILPIQGFFVAIGHKPNSELFLDSIDHDEVGYLKPTPGSTKTNIAGVFVSGDVADSVYRQAVSAAGTGCMAAIDAERFLAENEEENTQHIESIQSVSTIAL